MIINNVNLKRKEMYNILIATGKVLISASAKDLAVIAGSYLAGKIINKKMKKAKKSLK